MQTIDAEIGSRVAAFVTTLTALIKQAALESVEAALENATMVAPVKVTAKRGRPRKVVAPTPTPAPAAPAKSVTAAAPSKAPVPKKSARRRPSGAKRPPGELAKLTEKLGEYIKTHPGLRMEAIGKALGAPSRELNLPINRLLAAKTIRSEGHKRATQYFPA